MIGNDLSAAIFFQLDEENAFPPIVTNDALSTIAYGCAKLLLAVIVLAVLISLLVQALRDLGVRRSFQRYWVFSWLRTRAEAYAKSKEAIEAFATSKEAIEAGESKDPNTLAWRARQEISGLARRASVFNLSPGQLCGQLSARVQSLFSDNRKTDLMRLLEFDSTTDKDQSYKDQSYEEKKPPYDTDISTDVSPGQTAPSEEDSEASRRLDRIERAIDDLQLYLDQRWRTFDYIIGVFFAAALIALSIAWARGTGAQLRGAPFTLSAIVSVIASLLVPQVRPLIERLTRSR